MNTRRRVTRNRRTYNYAEDGRSGGGTPLGDLTIKIAQSSMIQLVRPEYEHADSLIFRMLPALLDTNDNQMECKWAPYRNSVEPYQWSDIMRSYPAAKYVGIDNERFTFLLYHPGDERDNPNFERKQNPYVLLYNALQRGMKQRTFPNMSWMSLVEGREAWVPKPTKIYFMQGLVFVKGKEIYLGSGKYPRGSMVKPNDKPQIIQLSVSAGGKLENLLNDRNIEYAPGEDDRIVYNEAMTYGDPIHPKYGRFVRVQNEKLLSESATADVSVVEWQQQATGGATVPAVALASGFLGYKVSLDKVLVLGEKPTKVTPNIDKETLRRVKKHIQWWDEVLHIPTTEELCLIIAKSLKGARAALEFAWADHPEYFTEDVMKVLKDAKQVLLGGGATQAPAVAPVPESLFEDPNVVAATELPAAPDGDDPELPEDEFDDFEDLDDANATSDDDFEVPTPSADNASKSDADESLEGDDKASDGDDDDNDDELSMPDDVPDEVKEAVTVAESEEAPFVEDADFGDPSEDSEAYEDEKKEESVDDSVPVLADESFDEEIDNAVAELQGEVELDEDESEMDDAMRQAQDRSGRRTEKESTSKKATTTDSPKATKGKRKTKRSSTP